MKTTTTISLAIAILALGSARAQDAHFSQYDAAAIMLNPAHTGMYENSDFRVSSNLRNQWGRLGANYLTTAFAVDMSMQEKYGFGAYLNNYNMAGIMNTFQAGLTAGYNVSKPKAKHTLSAGMNLGLIYKKINDSKLVWDAQYDRDHFNSDLPSGEDFRKAGRWMPDLGLGMAYRSKDPHRTVNPFANFAVFHVTMPDESIFREEKSKLPMRWSVNGGARITIMEGVDLMPQALYMLQGPDQQVQAGILGQAAFMNNIYSVVAGASYRLNDAIIAQAGIKHGNNVYRVSYDVNISGLKQYTRSNGALEFSMVYYGTLSGRARRVTSSAF
ncbi:MAG TPA: PorP/SprF family type IX secretion system membrane protein [Flavobacteriales bacterium]|nr:PorP/SprF family type IX secretion system membrane protein [Flavobacteriales bacterium]